MELGSGWLHIIHFDILARKVEDNNSQQELPLTVKVPTSGWEEGKRDVGSKVVRLLQAPWAVVPDHLSGRSLAKVGEVASRPLFGPAVYRKKWEVSLTRKTLQTFQKS